MLADKTAGLEERLEKAEQELHDLRKAGAGTTQVREVRVEVVPPSVQAAMGYAAQKAEEIADKLEAS